MKWIGTVPASGGGEMSRGIALFLWFMVLAMLTAGVWIVWHEKLEEKRKGYPADGVHYACVHVHLRSGWRYTDAQEYCWRYGDKWWDRGGREKYEKSVKNRPM